jgi:putative inorganic carbon (hco3(-)) transporter
MKKFLKLENIIYLSIAGLPFYLVKLAFFGIPSNVLEVIQVVIILWWLFGKNHQKPETREAFRKYGKYIIAASLILFGLLSSTIINGNYRVGAGIIKSWFLLPLFFSFIALNVINKEKMKNILLAIYFSSAAVSFIALAYYFLGRLTYDGRLEAFFNSPNYLAMFLAPGIIIGLLFFNENRKVYGISLWAILLVFYLTFSYAAWLSVIGAIPLALLLARKPIKKIVVGVIVILAALLFFQLGTKKWSALSNLEGRSSFSSHLMIWETAGKLAKDNPFWGIGPGNFQSKYLEYQKFFPPYLEWAVPHPHNLFLAFFLYSGLTGIVGLVALVFFWFRDVLEKENSKAKSIFLAIMVYILLHGLVDTTYFKNDLAILFWLNFLALNLKKAPEKGTLLNL